MYTLYSKNGLVLDTFTNKAAAMHAYRNWAQSFTLFFNNDVIASKWNT